MVGRGRWRTGTGSKLALAATLLAGCLSNPAPSVAPDPGAVVSGALGLLEAALVNDHDHLDPAEHPLAAWRLDQVFETNLPLDGAALSPPSEFIIHGDYAYVPLFHPTAGFVILDLADPAKPEQVGRYDSGTAYLNDIAISPDGRWAFLPTSPIETRENDPLDGGPIAAGDYGVQVVDVLDPTHPTLATVWVSPDPSVPPGDARTAVGVGYHRLDLETIGGSLYVFGAPLGFPRFDVLRFDPAPVPRLVPVGFYVADDTLDPAKDHGSGPNGYGIHDANVDPDPLEGFPLLAISHWRSGAHFVDVRDPAHPKFLGRWDDFPVPVGNVHNVVVTAIEGHRVAIASPEYPGDPDHQGGVWLVDVDDFAHPRLLGSFVLPGLHPTGGAAPATGNHVFSANQVRVRDGILFDAHFHAGVIVLDASTLAKAAHPELLGFLVPEGEARVPYSGVAANPYVYDAIPRGDHLYFTDLTGGFHVARMAPEIVQGRIWAG